MSETSVTAAGLEGRQSMLRVWMAISGVWVVFWLAIAGIIATNDIRYPLEGQLDLFAVIVLTPPLVLLALGVVGRWTFETFVQPARRSRSRKPFE
jgi:hypothetical protein